VGDNRLEPAPKQNLADPAGKRNFNSGAGFYIKSSTLNFSIASI
jgi:hypothetical protein